MVSMNFLRLRWRRRSTICRTLAVLLVCTLCFVVFARAKSHPQHLEPRSDDSDRVQKEASLFERSVRAGQQAALLETEDSEKWHLATKLEHDEVEKEPQQEFVQWKAPLAPEAKQDIESSERTSPDAHSTDASFVEAFERMVSLMPGTLTMKGLLAPFTETGEAHLQDLAIRVRVFKTAFEAWEKVHHLVTHDSIVAQNVLQRLRALPRATLDIKASVQSYDAFRFYLNSLAARLFPALTPYFGDLMSMHTNFYNSGKGIVLTMGDHQVRYVLTSIRSFRKLGCKLPIEIMYLGEEDLGEQEREQLEALPGVVTRDMSKMIDDHGWQVKGWAAKPWAILTSSFREVMFLDADVLFFSNPELMFDDEQYKESGALFFKDRNLGREKKQKWIRQILPKPISEPVRSENRLWLGESGHMQDSGVVVVDKWRHFIPLLLTARLNGPDRDGNEFEGKRGVYDMVYGDKETFWLSWEMAEEPTYAFHNGAVGIMGALKPAHPSNISYDPPDPRDVEEDAESSALFDERPSNYTVCSPQLLHFGTDGEPLWLNGWLSPDKFADPKNVRVDSFRVFLKETVKTGPEIWELMESNTCCLTVPTFERIAEEHTQTLGMLIEQAQELDWDSF